MIKGIPFFQAAEVAKCSSCFDSAEIVALRLSRRDLVVLADMGKRNVVDRELRRFPSRPRCSYRASRR
jgi:hypothetical protein